MNLKISLLAPALTLLLPVGAAFSQDVDAADCNSMLAVSIGMTLESEGLDLTNACNLTIAQLAQIKSLLDQDGMNSRAQIEKILADAAK